MNGNYSRDYGDYKPMNKVNSSSNNKGKKKMKLEDDSLEEEEGTERKIRKRNRSTISCLNCRNRKIKCDRSNPCEACLKRGDSCEWGSTVIIPKIQTFALATDYSALLLRVEALEKRGNEGRLNGGSEMDEKFNEGRQEIKLNDQVDDIEEEAALVLEELALGRRLQRNSIRRRSLESQSHPIIPTPTSSFPSTHYNLIVPPLESRRKLVYDSLLRDLPSKEMLHFLISNFFSKHDWSWHIHHKPTFLTDFNNFLILKDSHQMDPLFLAVLYQTCCLSIHSLDTAIESQLVSITNEDLISLPNVYFNNAVAALECGDWLKPRIRTILTIALFAPFLLFSGNNCQAERLQIYLAAGLRICTQLGLHQLGSNEDNMPPLDLSLPTNVCTLRRALPIRYFHVLLFVDWMSARAPKIVNLPAEFVKVALPLNLNDEDLSATEVISIGKPSHIKTDASFEIIKFKIAGLQRKYNNSILAETFNYSLVEELDASYRSILEDIPLSFRADYISNTNESTQDKWTRALVIQTIENRILRLHRPFMNRGYKEQSYSNSTVAALESARILLKEQRHLTAAPLVKEGFQVLTLQGAIVVLISNLWTQFSREFRSSSDFILIRSCLPFFAKLKSSRHLVVRNIVSQSTQVHSLLFEALDTRSRIGSAENEISESWGTLLSRLAQTVVESSKLNSFNATPVISQAPADNVWSNFAPPSMIRSPVAITSDQTPLPDFDLFSLEGEFIFSTFDQFGSLSSF